MEVVLLPVGLCSPQREWECCFLVSQLNWVFLIQVSVNYFFTDLVPEINKTDGASHPYQHGVVETAGDFTVRGTWIYQNQLYETTHPCDFTIWNVIMKLCSFILKSIHIIPMGNRIAERMMEYKWKCLAEQMKYFYMLISLPLFFFLYFLPLNNKIIFTAS